MKNQTTVNKYTYTVQGNEKHNVNSTFEDCIVFDREYTKEQVLLLYNAQCNCRYIGTNCMIDSIKTITIDLLNETIVSVEEEEI